MIQVTPFYRERGITEKGRKGVRVMSLQPKKPDIFHLPVNPLSLGYYGLRHGCNAYRLHGKAATLNGNRQRQRGGPKTGPKTCSPTLAYGPHLGKVRSTLYLFRCSGLHNFWCASGVNLPGSCNFVVGVNGKENDREEHERV